MSRKNHGFIVGQLELKMIKLITLEKELPVESFFLTYKSSSSTTVMVSLVKGKHHFDAVIFVIISTTMLRKLLDEVGIM